MLRIDTLPVEVDVEDTAPTSDQPGSDAEGCVEPGSQTGRLGLVVSLHAVRDGDVHWKKLSLIEELQLYLDREQAAKRPPDRTSLEEFQVPSVRLEPLHLLVARLEDAGRVRRRVESHDSAVDGGGRLVRELLVTHRPDERLPDPVGRARSDQFWPEVTRLSYDAVAEMYEAAFAWEGDPGVILPLYEQLGRPGRVIEVACGPAWLLASLVAEGAHGIGIDVSAPMLTLARRRLAAARPGSFELVHGDMRDFTLNAPASGAFCAVGSFGHLATREDAVRHLTSMRPALTSGAIYAIQMRLQPIHDSEARGPNEHSTWEFEYAGERLAYAWFGRGIEASTARETQVSRIEWLTGPKAGEVVETNHNMHIWDWASWTELLAATGFVQIAALDPNRSFEEIPLGEALYQHPVAWHLIARE